MPDHKSHALFGAGLWLVLVIFLVLSNPSDTRTIVKIGLVSSVFCFLGSILPDIDEKHTKIFKQVRFLIFIIVFVISYSALTDSYPTGSLGEMLYVLAVCSMIALASVLFFYAIVPAHRKGVHSVIAGALYCLFALACSYVLLSDLWMAGLIALFSFLAYLSHLALDRSIK